MKLSESYLKFARRWHRAREGQEQLLAREEDWLPEQVDTPKHMIMIKLSAYCTIIVADSEN